MQNDRQVQDHTHTVCVSESARTHARGPCSCVRAHEKESERASERESSLGTTLLQGLGFRVLDLGFSSLGTILLQGICIIAQARILALVGTAAWVKTLLLLVLSILISKSGGGIVQGEERSA